MDQIRRSMSIERNINSLSNVHEWIKSFSPNVKIESIVPYYFQIDSSNPFGIDFGQNTVFMGYVFGQQNDGMEMIIDLGFVLIPDLSMSGEVNSMKLSQDTEIWMCINWILPATQGIIIGRGYKITGLRFDNARP